MVFHAFDVVIDGVVVESEEFEKIGEQLVSPRDVPGECFAGCGEGEAAVFFVFEESVRVEALDHIRDAGL